MIDIHCHILPGLDDGAQFLDESVRMAKLAWEDGIEKIVAAPHIYRGGSTELKNLEVIEEKLEELKESLKQSNIKTEVFPGAEVHISHNFVANVKMNRKYITINRSSYMLVEFPSSHIFSNVRDLFYNLMEEGIIPIIAHPERNNVFREHPDLLYDLIMRGAFAQANSGSLLGLYGRRIQETAHIFLQLNLIHFFGSDGHNTMSHCPQLSEAKKIVKSNSGEKVAEELFQNNPMAVLEDQELSYLPEPINPLKRKKTFKLRIPQVFRKNS